MTMIEKIAREIYQWQFGSMAGWNDVHPNTRERWTGAARAALEAMKEPTTSMYVAGSDELGKPRKTLPKAWHAMIEAALSEK